MSEFDLHEGKNEAPSDPCASSFEDGLPTHGKVVGDHTSSD